MTDLRTVRTFYDELADDYHFLYGDWDASVQRQGVALDRILRAELGDQPRQIWDCACGIGTQAIGLATQGHQVVGTDLSPSAAARAGAEARSRGLTLPTAAADMRHLPVTPGGFDAVVCADNALAHLLSRDDIAAALRTMRTALREDGLLLLSMRGYDQIRTDHPSATPPQVAHTARGRIISFQLWHWHEDGERYDLEHIQLHPAAGPNGPGAEDWTVRTRRTTSWALTRDEVAAAVADAGFRDITWRLPEDTGFFQPLLVARAPRNGG
ncbi:MULTISPECIES: bifunctional 2-polyprenyl-6-hydroxyphenol methylase/3-demethylubiquinol 3-O-methyltransferase UbiG [Streptacidiphilus]|uniref:Class I SAM-dependent methyltransferase n=1 Tax=Streptacidiphilus cavernicola TaxID=3342716 RepID=A0ABV6UWJ1_9ACTN|nr:class I SAM-dependent methyltransferase [Streptacidiphilus jeojiense]